MIKSVDALKKYDDARVAAHNATREALRESYVSQSDFLSRRLLKIKDQVDLVVDNAAEEQRKKAQIIARERAETFEVELKDALVDIRAYVERFLDEAKLKAEDARNDPRNLPIQLEAAQANQRYSAALAIFWEYKLLGRENFQTKLNEVTSAFETKLINKADELKKEIMPDIERLQAQINDISGIDAVLGKPATSSVEYTEYKNWLKNVKQAGEEYERYFDQYLMVFASFIGGVKQGLKDGISLSPDDAAEQGASKDAVKNAFKDLQDQFSSAFGSSIEDMKTEVKTQLKDVLEEYKDDAEKAVLDAADDTVKAIETKVKESLAGT